MARDIVQSYAWIRGDDHRMIGEVLPPGHADGVVLLTFINGTEDEISEKAEAIRDELRAGRIPS